MPPAINFYLDEKCTRVFNGNLGRHKKGELREITIWSRNDGDTPLHSGLFSLEPTGERAPITFAILDQPPEVWKPGVVFPVQLRSLHPELDKWGMKHFTLCVEGD